MPRQARLDAPGTLHHVMVRGIERRRIIKDVTDCNKFNLDAQKERGKEKVNKHRLKVLERECNAVRSLWPHVTHKIAEDWNVVPYSFK